MEALFSSLNLGGNGARYCTVSTDNDQPEIYEDEHSRQPQSALERLTDLSGAYDKFSRHPCDAEDAQGVSVPARGSSSGGGVLQRIRQDLSGALAAVERLGRSSHSPHNHKHNQRPHSLADPGDLSIQDADESLVDACLREDRLSRPASHSTIGVPGMVSSWSPWSESDRNSEVNEDHSAGRSDASLLSMFDHLTQKHRQSQISEFDRCFPISTNDGQWGSGAAWENSELAAPLTKAAKQRQTTTKTVKSTTAGGATNANDVSLIDLAGSSTTASSSKGKDNWTNWEDEAWESLSRK